MDTDHDDTAYVFTVGSNSTVSPGTELFRWRLPDEHYRYMRGQFTIDAAGFTASGLALYLQPRW
jgi:hypothetical protein